jgi:GNAT superfamily N-acetyltransferase
MIEIIDLKQVSDYLATLAQWHQKEWAYLNPGETLEQRMTRMQPYLNQCFIPSTFIARDTTLLGSAAIVENDMSGEPPLSQPLTPWLASVFVAPEYRQMGIGTKLVRHVMAQAKQQGVETLYLYTPDKSKFYEKLGWRMNSIEPYHGHQVSIMQATLNKD